MTEEEKTEELPTPEESPEVKNEQDTQSDGQSQYACQYQISKDGKLMIVPMQFNLQIPVDHLNATMRKRLVQVLPIYHKTILQSSAVAFQKMMNMDGLGKKIINPNPKPKRIIT